MAKRVLVIDDEEEFCDMIKSYLEPANRFEVVALTDPRQALQTAKTFKPDVILLDLRMPHTGGFEVCQMLNDDEDTKRIPVIIISALTGEGDEKKAFHYGVSAYLRKPLELKKLLINIDEITNR